MEKKIKIRVSLEPKLEAQVALMTPAQRREMARLFFRWSKQLYVSAAILEADAQPLPQRAIKPLPRRRLFLN